MQKKILFIRFEANNETVMEKCKIRDINFKAIKSNHPLIVF